MKSIVLTLPTFGFILATRAALAAGIALLVADKLPAARRRAIGTALVAVGAATTVPAVNTIRRGLRLAPRWNQDSRLVGAVRFPRKGDDEAW